MTASKLTFDDQIWLVRRIAADLFTEATRHRQDGRETAAVDCDEKATQLADVMESLIALKNLSQAIKNVI